MFSNRRLVVGALALAIFAGVATVAPATASADPTPAAGSEHKRKEAPQFPMDAAAFRHLVDKHIEHARVHLRKQMDEHNVPQATRTEITKRFEEATKQIRTAVERVTNDGTVTKEEAKEVHHLSRELKRKAMAELRGQKRARKDPS